MRRANATKRMAARLAAVFMACTSSLAFAAVTLADLQANVDAGEFDQAADQAEAYLELHPGNRDARFLHARALAGRGDTAAAIAAYEQLAADYPQRVEPANNLAVLYADRGEFEQARRWLEKALATQPAYATAHRNLGDVYTALAELAYRKALGTEQDETQLPLTMLDRLYYAQESIASGSAPTPAPQRRPATEAGAERTVGDADSRSILQTVRAWAQAWSGQDFEAYTDFYAEAFSPGDDLSREEWVSLRRARLSTPEDIHIRIEDPNLERRSEDTIEVSFTQDYESPRYSDRVQKRLVMTRTDGGWRIVRETTGSN